MRPKASRMEPGTKRSSPHIHFLYSARTPGPKQARLCAKKSGRWKSAQIAPRILGPGEERDRSADHVRSGGDGLRDAAGREAMADQQLPASVQLRAHADSWPARGRCRGGSWRLLTRVSRGRHPSTVRGISRTLFSLLPSILFARGVLPGGNDRRDYAGAGLGWPD